MRSVKHIFFYSLVFCVFPLTTATAGVAGTAMFLGTLIGSGIFGSLLLQKWISENAHLDALIFILLGNITIQFLGGIHFFIVPLLLGLSLGYGLIYLIKNFATTRFDIDTDIIMGIVLAFIFLFIGKDVKEANSQYVIFPTNDDNYYFSALTESMIKGSYWDSFLDKGAPINYQITSFLFPASFSKISGISGHLSLWAYVMPFYKFISLLIFGFCIKQLLMVRKIQPSFVIFFSVLLALTLSSLNIVNLLRFKWSSLVFFAAGNFWPGGNPGMTLGFALTILAAFFIFRNYSHVNLWLAGYCSVIIILTKIAMWYPVMALMALFVLLHGFKKSNSRAFFITIITGVISFGLYMIFYSKDSAAKFVVQPFAELQALIFRSFKIDSANTLKNLVLFAGYLVLSFGLRLVILALPFFKNGDRSLRKISLATVGSVILSALLILPFKIYFYDLSGKIVYDSSYNLEQFLRSCYILVMFASVFILFYQLPKLTPVVKKLAVSAVFIYCAMIAFGNYTYYKNFYASYKNVDNEWRVQVRSYLQSNLRKDGLLCMLGNSLEYKAHDLAADGVGQWWYSGRTNDGSIAYFFSTRNHSRRIPIMDSVLQSTNPTNAFATLKNEQVRYMISTPDSIIKERISYLQKTGYIMPTACQYVYEIK